MQDTAPTAAADTPQWYVLRDLKRPNAKTPAYKALPELGIDTFTPMHWVVTDNPAGGKTRRYTPCVHGLLFARALRATLDPIIARTDTLQYRFVKGAPQNTPMTVPTPDMERFLRAVSSAQDCIYYSPSEITPDMIGRQVRIVGGILDGTVGHLLKQKGTRKKRLILQLRDTIAAAIEIQPDYIQLI